MSKRKVSDRILTMDHMETRWVSHYGGKIIAKAMLGSHKGLDKINLDMELRIGWLFDCGGNTIDNSSSLLLEYSINSTIETLISSSRETQLDLRGD